jgi:hypothetical protein
MGNDSRRAKGDGMNPSGCVIIIPDWRMHGVSDEEFGTIVAWIALTAGTDRAAAEQMIRSFMHGLPVHIRTGAGMIVTKIRRGEAWDIGT